MTMIDIHNLTKDYGGGKGVFDVSISIKKGEVYGYLGPNGAGKSTTDETFDGFYKASVGQGLYKRNGLLERPEEDTEDFRISSRRNIFS